VTNPLSSLCHHQHSHWKRVNTRFCYEIDSLVSHRRKHLISICNRSVIPIPTQPQTTTTWNSSSSSMQPGKQGQRSDDPDLPVITSPANGPRRPGRRSVPRRFQIKRRRTASFGVSRQSLNGLITKTTSKDRLQSTSPSTPRCSDTPRRTSWFPGPLARWPAVHRSPLRYACVHGNY
jgi:hypothetical protein